MAINTKWVVKIGPASAPIDFTTYLAGVSVDQEVPIAKYATQKAQVTLWNYTGFLTPGGGGTYSSTDWFNQGVWVYARTDIGGATTDTLVFAGIVDSFDLEDDGEQSSVTFGCVDALTIAGRQLPGTAPVRTFGTSREQVYVNFGTVTWPSLSDLLSIVPYTVNSVGGDTTGALLQSDTTVANKTLADILNQSVLPAQNSVLWQYDQIYSSGVVYRFAIIGHGLTRDNLGSGTTNTFVFDTAPNVSGTELPFTNISQGWSTDALTNYASVQNLAATPLSTVWFNPDSLAKYGSRAVQFNNIMLTDTWDTISISAEWPNRFNTPRFTPQTLTITSANVKSYAADAAHDQWKYLLSVLNGLWQKATVTWKGTGLSVTQTAEVVITGRKIKATPDNTTVTLSLSNWTDYHSFILNTDKLDINHLA